MRRARWLLLLSGVILGLLIPSAASASISQVFGSVTCTEQTSGATAGQRWCGSSSGTTVASWDGTPIDVAVGFPVASGSDNDYPVIGIYHGWGSSKITPSSSAAQRWLKQGYAVFSISDRGWGASCGGSSSTLKPPPCERGYIHLMARAYEVRDVQYLLGLLADEGVIDPQKIAATGGSYGGGMSLQLGSLKDRIQLPSGELIPWVSPKGTPLKIAATAPEFPWTDLAQSLMPNGSGLDYVANDPYQGVFGEHRVGIQKQSWNEILYNAGKLLGYYAPTSADDPEANIIEWNTFDSTGGPYDGQPLAIQQEQQLPNHSPYYTSLSDPPAPALMENGWNDDLFPVDETVRYYDKVRASYPNAAMKLFYMDFGHNPRSTTSVSTTDLGKLQAAQNAWFAYYVKGEGSEPAQAHGGVTAITSVCPTGSESSGHEYDAPNWASLAPGEIRLNSAGEQTIQAPGTAPANAFTSGNVCTTQTAGDNASAATYKLSAAPASGFTIAGSPTVIAEFSTPEANDQLIARLYDVNVPGGGSQQLIGRQTYRPLNPGEGFTKQVFQLHPQAWNVASGHVIKLELLVQDSPYARDSSSPHSIQVRNLELRLPTTDPPGSAEGLVQAPLSKYLPPGYTLARNVTPAPPNAPHISSGSNPNAGEFTLAWEPSQAATAPTYTLQHKNASSGWSNVATGLTSPEYSFTSTSPEAAGTWTYRVTESNEGPESEPSEASTEVKVEQNQAPEYGRCLKHAGGKFKDGGCKTPAIPGEEKYEWYPGFSGERPILKTGFKDMIKPETIATLETRSGSKVTCTGQEDIGNYTGAKTTYMPFVRLTGCESISIKCNSPEAASGEIVTVPLVGVLGVYKTGETPAKNKLGDDLSPAVGEEFGHVECGAVPINVIGHVISPIPANAMKLTATIKFAATSGKQKPERFVGEPKQIIESSFAGGPFEQSGLTIATIQTNEERIEASSVN